MDRVTIEVDAHKRSHTAVAVGQTGQRLAERTVTATAAGRRCRALTRPPSTPMSWPTTA